MEVDRFFDTRLICRLIWLYQQDITRIMDYVILTLIPLYHRFG